MRWTEASFTNGQPPPSPRSGHSATVVNGGEDVVVFGGLHTSNFIGETVVLSLSEGRWWRPPSAAVGGPGPRAFHCAVAVDKQLFVICGRTGRQQHGDTWVLDTTTWEWRPMGRMPGAVGSDTIAPRDFGTAQRVGGTDKIVLFGGYDGKKWLSDAHVLDTANGVWRLLNFPSPSPSPRSGHAMSTAQNGRHLLFGGQGPNGTLCHDLWALRGVDETIRDDDHDDTSPSRDPPAHASSLSSSGGGGARWTRLQLRGDAPAARAGHALVALDRFIVVFGGGGGKGWMSKQQEYRNDLHVIDRESMRWRRLAGSAPSEAGRGGLSPTQPGPRAFHAMCRVGERALLIGGFTGSEALNDVWWLDLDEGDGTGGLGGSEGGSDLSAMAALSAPMNMVSSTISGLSSPFDRMSQSLFGGIGEDAKAAAVAGSPDTKSMFSLTSLGDAFTGRRTSHAGRESANLENKTKEEKIRGVLESIDGELAAKAKSEGNHDPTGMNDKGWIREFYASCDPEDLKIGDMKRFVREYRGAVGAQALGTPADLTGTDGPGQERRGRFLHVEAESLRLADVPAMLTELQGALIEGA